MTNTLSVIIRTTELDFVIVQDGVVKPVEVKSGKDYERHNALNNVLNVSNYDIPAAYVLCNDNLSVKGKRTDTCLFFAFHYKELLVVQISEHKQP